MKKILAVILTVLMIFSAVSMGVVAGDDEKVPVVILQGYSGPDLAYADENGEPIFDENGNVQLAWPLNFDSLGEDITALLADVTLNQEDLGDSIVDVLQEYFEPLEMNPDGTSKNNLVPYPSGAANTRASTLIENGMEQYVPEAAFAEMAIEEVGAENVFGFTQDWRQSQVDSAADLDKYIQEVKALTGADKVDIYGLSHGGQYGTSYLYYYGHKGDVRNAVFGNPATLGTSAVGSFFTGEYVDVNLQDVIRFVEHGFEYEQDWEWLLQLLTLDEFLVEIVNSALVNTDLLDGIVLIPSLWDFVPHNYFENALQYVGLTESTNGKLYNDTVKFHADVNNDGLNLANKLADLKASGMKIGYVCGSGYDSVNGKYNSDILIDTYLSSGSDCALANETFPSDYMQANTVCNNPDHYHISPEFDIDASAGFLPDATWFVRNQGHGMIMHDEYSKNLVHDFMWGDVESVYSSKEYPQFNMSQNNSEIIYTRFNNTSSGYHSTNDDELIIKNMSVEADAVIWSIEAVGADIDFDYSQGLTIPKGNVVNIGAINNDFDSAEIPFEVRITYSLLNTQLTYVTNVFCFTPMTDEQIEKYSYLSNVADVLPDEIPETTVPDETIENTTEADTETPIENTTAVETTTMASTDSKETTTKKADEQTTAKNEDKKENVEAEDIPKTNRSVTTVLTSLAVLIGASITVCAVVKKKENE